MASALSVPLALWVMVMGLLVLVMGLLVLEMGLLVLEMGLLVWIAVFTSLTVLMVLPCMALHSWLRWMGLLALTEMRLLSLIAVVIIWSSFHTRASISGICSMKVPMIPRRLQGL